MEFNVQQQKTIDNYRMSHNLGYVLTDEAVAELIKKEMEQSGTVYPGFENLAKSVAKSQIKKTTQDAPSPVKPTTSIFGPLIVGNETEPFSIEKTTITYPETQPTEAQNEAIKFLNDLTSDADTTFQNREMEAGALSAVVNTWQEVFNKQYAKSTVKKELETAKEDLRLLELAAKGQFGYTDFLGDTHIKSFEEVFKQRRGVKFDENAVADCSEKAEQFAAIRTSVEIINQTKQTLSYTTKGDVHSQMHPQEASASIIKAFQLAGVNSLDEMNKTLQDIEEKYKNHPDIKEYGGNLRFEKNERGQYVIYRTSITGKKAEAAIEELRLIEKEMGLRLDKALATALGVEFSENATAEEMAALTQQTLDKSQKEYEESFAKAYGKKNVKALSEAYVLKQQQGVANIEMGLNIASMALMVVPGGAVAAGGWALKGVLLAKHTATGAKVVKGLNLVGKAKTFVKGAQTLQKISQVASPFIMANMTLRPTELLEQLTSENGMSADEWKAWGEGVIQNSIYMAAGMGASKLAETGAAMYKTKALVSTLKSAGKSTDEIMAMIKANPVKFPNEIVKSLSKVDALAKTLQVSSEVALDIGSTVLVNKALGNGELLKQDVINSIAFAISGGVLQKQFMPLSSEAKVSFIQNALKEYGITKVEAERILNVMDDISAGKLRAEDIIPLEEHQNSLMLDEVVVTAERNIDTHESRTQENVRKRTEEAKQALGEPKIKVTTYEEAISKFKTSKSAKETIDADGNKVIIYHQNLANLGDYSFVRFDSAGKMVEQGTISPSKLKDAFGKSVDEFSKINKENNLMMSLDAGILESIGRTLKLNYDVAKFKVAPSIETKMAVMLGFDVNNPKAMETFNAKLKKAGLKEGMTETEVTEAIKREFVLLNNSDTHSGVPVLQIPKELQPLYQSVRKVLPDINENIAYKMTMALDNAKKSLGIGPTGYLRLDTSSSKFVEEKSRLGDDGHIRLKDANNLAFKFNPETGELVSISNEESSINIGAGQTVDSQVRSMTSKYGTKSVIGMKIKRENFDGTPISHQEFINSDVAGQFKIYDIAPNGKSYLVGLAERSANGDSFIEKNLVSLDGIRTEEVYRSDAKGNRFLYQKITDANGVVLSEITKKHKMISENHFITSTNNQYYEVEITDTKLVVTKLDAEQNKTSEKVEYDIVDLSNTSVKDLDFNKEYSNTNIKMDDYFNKLGLTGKQFVVDKRLLPTIRELSGEEWFKLHNANTRLLYGECEIKGNASSGVGIITVSETVDGKLSATEHEIGHEIFASKNFADNMELRAIYEAEKEAFTTMFPDDVISLVSYFLKSNENSMRGLNELVAETNLITSVPQRDNAWSARTVLLQQYFPKTIAYILKNLNVIKKSSNAIDSSNNYLARNTISQKKDNKCETVKKEVLNNTQILNLNEQNIVNFDIERIVRKFELELTEEDRNYLISNLDKLSYKFNLSQKDIEDFINKYYNAKLIVEDNINELYITNITIDSYQLFNLFNLSYDEKKRMHECIIKNNSDNIVKILEENNPKLCEVLNAKDKTYLSNLLLADIGVLLQFNGASTNYTTQSEKNGVLFTNDNYHKISVNGRDKIVYANTTNDLKVKNVTVYNLRDAIQSNLITLEVINSKVFENFNDLNLDYNTKVKIKVQRANRKDSFTIDTTYKTIIEKIRNNEFVNSAEKHSLTDYLKDKLNEQYLASLLKDYNVKNKLTEIMGIVEYYKKSINSKYKNPKKYDTSDHFYMRMIDRNLSSVVLTEDDTLLHGGDIVNMFYERIEKENSKKSSKKQQLETPIKINYLQAMNCYYDIDESGKISNMTIFVVPYLDKNLKTIQ